MIHQADFTCSTFYTSNAQAPVSKVQHNLPMSGDNVYSHQKEGDNTETVNDVVLIVRLFTSLNLFELLNLIHTIKSRFKVFMNNRVRKHIQCK